MKINRAILFVLGFVFFVSSSLQADDWPVYKGNLYLTGNNDEIIVKTNYIKWIFKAEYNIHNPIISDHKIYFLDQAFNLFCIDEETGQFIWRTNLIEISKEFTGTTRSPGKIKYPVIKDNLLILTDSTMIYAFNKNTGKVVWSRTAMNDEEHPEKYNRMRIDGIYSDPTIHNDEILYGTRNVFMARKLINGHLSWTRNDIKSYSGFPVYYDDFIFTQSMDFASGKFTVYCLDLETGKEVWKKNLDKPFKIFSPVVNDRRVFFPSGQKVFVLSLDDGHLLWEKDYKEYITSDLSFTSREIIFSLNNKDVVFVNPENGEIIKRYNFNEVGNPWFVLTRDQIYISKTTHKDGQEVNPSYTSVVAYSSHGNEKPLWEFKSPFPGAASQPVSSGGILFVPSGNYLYALGSLSETRLKKTDNNYFIEKTNEKGSKVEEKAIREEGSGENKKGDDLKNQPKDNNNSARDKPQGDNKPFRNLEVEIQDENRKPINGEAEVIERKDGQVISKNIYSVRNGRAVIPVPDKDNIEVVLNSPDRIPKKAEVKKDDRKISETLEKVEAGKSYNVDNIEFEVNQDYLKAESLDILKKLADILKKNPNLKVEIIGHTDSTGDEKYNQELSERRAESVTDYLVKQGISPLRLKARGMGEKKPIADNNTEEGRRKNRRTEFKVY